MPALGLSHYGQSLKVTNHQTGREEHNITRYVTNHKCVLILDMVPTEICLEVVIPYVGPNDGER